MFWHRLGNSLEGVGRALAWPQTRCGERPVAPGVELDLKWVGSRLYAHHGPTGRERLSAAQLDRGSAEGRVLPLERLLAHPGASELRYLIELKCGRGSPRGALDALRRQLDGRGLLGQAWLAASSLELLQEARACAPELPRVLFAAPGGRDRVWHRPTTLTLRSLVRHGVRPRVGREQVDRLCVIGVRPRDVEAHAALADAARARGLGYLPGRVTTLACLEALSRAGHAGAFAYGDPERLTSNP